MQSQNSNIPYSPEYIEIGVDQEKSIEDQQENILSQTQGEFVILKENSSISSLMKVVSLFRRTVQEVVFETNSGLKVVLFSNTSDTTIRSSDVNLDFVSLSLNTSHQNHPQIIDLDKVYSEQNSSSEIESLQSSFEKVKKIVASPVSLTLIGSQSPLLFLLIQSKLSSETKELFYQKDTNRLLERIF